METKCCNCDKLGDVCSNPENVWMCWDCFYELPVIEPTEYTPEENKFPVQLPPPDEWPF